MQENELYKPICDGALVDQIRLIKIVDGSVGKKPFDMFGITCKGIGVAVEVKVWRKVEMPSSWEEIDKLYESQQKPWLMEWANMSGVGILVLYHEHTDRMFAVRLTASGEYEKIVEMYKHRRVWRGMDSCFMLEEIGFVGKPSYVKS